jgi:uncharacterized membrane protein YphA (DoxX/SURF4 family)
MPGSSGSPHLSVRLLTRSTALYRINRRGYSLGSHSGLIVGSNSHFFAYLTAAVETDLAAFLILGLFTHVTCIVGFVWSLAIWAIPEGFGGLYKPSSSSDVGPALLYPLMFAGFFAI